TRLPISLGFSRHHIERELRIWHLIVITKRAFGQVLNRGVWLANEVVDCFAQPMVTTCVAKRFIHALLHDAPIPFTGEKETMVIEIIAVLNRRRVHFCAHLRGVNEFLSLNNGVLVRGVSNFLWSLSADRPFSPGDNDAEVVAQSF